MRVIFPIFMALFLSGCMFCSHPDYAPTQKVDVSKIKNATPKKVSKSRYGNPDFYFVNGKEYHVLKSAKGFDEKGIASWYGMKFAGHRTSTNEIYDPLKMTAANKALPLPTYVKVTNLKNSKWVIVKVNDRGPFKNNRIIDLSFVAAKKLGIVKYGTGHVRVQAIDPEIKKGPYLQVGVYRYKTNAEKIKKRLAGVFKEPVTITKEKTLYRVKIGPLKNKKSLALLSKQIKTLHLS